jgi:hypothetical protein
MKRFITMSRGFFDIFFAPRCFQWVKKEDRGKSGTQEIRKRNGRK